MKLFRRVVSLDLYLFLALGIFLVLTLPSIDNIPHRDGNILFVQSYVLFSGGFHQFFQKWANTHPPFTMFVGSLGFLLGGVHEISFNMLGRLLGLMGIVGIYQISFHMMNRVPARWSALLLALSPLYIANALFLVPDFLLAVFTIIAVAAYQKKRYPVMSVFLIFGVLTKETGLVLPVVILIAESIYFAIHITKHKDVHGYTEALAFAFIPVFIFFYWLLFLTSNGATPWSAEILTPAGQHGSFYTVLHNLLTFSFINPYAIQNWLHLFVLNFAWMYWAVFLISVLVYTVRRGSRILTDVIRNKTLTVSIIFCVVYIITVLSFQTYTIPRYVLPVVPFMILGFSWAVSTLVRRRRVGNAVSIAFVAVFVLLSLFRSADPVSLLLWGKTDEFGETLYNMRAHSSGNDGVTYNMQYVRITDKRTVLVRAIESGAVHLQSEEDCRKVFPDPSDDKISLSALGYTRTMYEGLADCTFNW